ncbi:MAG TPA: universal stress protein [Gordonia sp. (in: high G+C Gram-positive bacteria)]|uniref:universal stress protein n=1 Tax=unclassified Gordonia (in: high G+C Gram-positive bacteria) TaxID=2657482 RepID=UPI000FB61250|nr:MULTISPECIES: universal stress protein [unclassified Gordonia (in: high G+C Gram-positive bacteria)]RUP40893.1 MAG: universal stress protein [Gordonia sp. (in: high G+C Gram-positive bacteria)]HNP57717.1 universal stress protein [Gordonia sp. (in: high G+C Gram-positive bacteria)]HRC51304.1 universal stress protein [Gordonia sp. (in: high G+C Gram-positive bacteria)]
MRIFVAYLANDGGADAVCLGGRLARSLRAELDIGLIAPGEQRDEALAEVVREQAADWLDDAQALVPDVPSEAHVAFHDSIAPGIITEAQRVGASAIVVGGSGGGMVGSHSLGSVVNDLLRASPLPVVLAPQGLRNSPVDRMTQITCALGTRPNAAVLLDFAIASAQAAHVPLRLISLVALDQLPTGEPVPDAQERAMAHAHQVLHTARERLPKDIEVNIAIVHGPTVEDAVERLDWHDGDLLLVGSSRLAAPQRIFLGSTAAKMLRVLSVPVAVLPSGTD